MDPEALTIVMIVVVAVLVISGIYYLATRRGGGAAGLGTVLQAVGRFFYVWVGPEMLWIIAICAFVVLVAWLCWPESTQQQASRVEAAQTARALTASTVHDEQFTNGARRNGWDEIPKEHFFAVHEPDTPAYSEINVALCPPEMKWHAKIPENYYGFLVTTSNERKCLGVCAEHSKNNSTKIDMGEGPLFVQIKKDLVEKLPSFPIRVTMRLDNDPPGVTIIRTRKWCQLGDVVRWGPLPSNHEWQLYVRTSDARGLPLPEHLAKTYPSRVIIKRPGGEQPVSFWNEISDLTSSMSPEKGGELYIGTPEIFADVPLQEEHHGKGREGKILVEVILRVHI